MYNLLLLNWYLLGVKMNLGHAHKTRFWYLLGVFSGEHPVTFIGECPPGKYILLTRSMSYFWSSSYRAQ